MTMLEQIARDFAARDTEGLSWREYLPDARAAVERLREYHLSIRTKSQRDSWLEAIDAILNEEDK